MGTIGTLVTIRTLGTMGTKENGKNFYKNYDDSRTRLKRLILSSRKTRIVLK